MLLIVTFAVISIVSLCVAKYTFMKTNSDIDILATIIAVFSVVSTIASIIAVFVTLISCRFDAAADRVRYESIMYQVEHNFYDNENEVGLSKLVEDIQEWNEDLRTYEEGKNNPWLNIFFPKDISDYKYIDMSLLRRADNNDRSKLSKD